MAALAFPNMGEAILNFAPAVKPVDLRKADLFN
jgi:hypothetical protein